MKAKLSVKKTQKGTLEIVLTDEDIYVLLEEKGIFLDLEESVLQSSEFQVFYRDGERSSEEFDVDRNNPISCKLSWEFEE